MDEHRAHDLEIVDLCLERERRIRNRYQSIHVDTPKEEARKARVMRQPAVPWNSNTRVNPVRKFCKSEAVRRATPPSMSPCTRLTKQACCEKDQWRARVQRLDNQLQRMSLGTRLQFENAVHENDDEDEAYLEWVEGEGKKAAQSWRRMQRSMPELGGVPLPAAFAILAVEGGAGKKGRLHLGAVKQKQTGTKRPEGCEEHDSEDGALGSRIVHNLIKVLENSQVAEGRQESNEAKSHRKALKAGKQRTEKQAAIAADLHLIIQEVAALKASAHGERSPESKPPDASRMIHEEKADARGEECRIDEKGTSLIRGNSPLTLAHFEKTDAEDAEERRDDSSEDGEIYVHASSVQTATSNGKSSTAGSDTHSCRSKKVAELDRHGFHVRTGILRRVRPRPSANELGPLDIRPEGKHWEDFSDHSSMGKKQSKKLDQAKETKENVASSSVRGDFRIPKRSENKASLHLAIEARDGSEDEADSPSLRWFRERRELRRKISQQWATEHNGVRAEELADRFTVSCGEGDSGGNGGSWQEQTSSTDHSNCGSWHESPDASPSRAKGRESKDHTMHGLCVHVRNAEIGRSPPSARSSPPSRRGDMKFLEQFGKLESHSPIPTAPSGLKCKKAGARKPTQPATPLKNKTEFTQDAFDISDRGPHDPIRVVDSYFEPSEPTSSLSQSRSGAPDALHCPGLRWPLPARDSSPFRQSSSSPTSTRHRRAAQQFFSSVARSPSRSLDELLDPRLTLSLGKTRGDYTRLSSGSGADSRLTNMP